MEHFPKLLAKGSAFLLDRWRESFKKGSLSLAVITIILSVTPHKDHPDIDTHVLTHPLLNYSPYI